MAMALGAGVARGQGELYLVSAANAERRLDAGRAIVERAGLSSDMHGFVPPAWLLSSAARRVVKQAGFAFHEEPRASWSRTAASSPGA